MKLLVEVDVDNVNKMRMGVVNALRFLSSRWRDFPDELQEIMQGSEGSYCAEDKGTQIEYAHVTIKP